MTVGVLSSVLSRITKRVRADWRELRRQPVILVTVLVSLGLQAFAFVFVRPLRAGDPLFVTEIRALLVVSAVLDVIASSARVIGRFRVFHIVRFGAIMAIVVVMRSTAATIDLVLLLPFILETVLFERERVAVGELAVFLIATVIVRVITFPVEPGALEAEYVSGLIGTAPALIAFQVALCALFTTGLALYAIHYRERSVSLHRRIESLEATVTSLTEANKRFQVYADSMESRTVERERSTITRDLHDTVGYALTNVIVMMNAAKVLASTSPFDLPPLFDRIRDQTELALDETRTILYRLRDLPRAELSGISAVRHLVQSFQGATGIGIELHQGNVPDSLGQKLDAVLFRIVQEGLTNAFRHGNATRVSIQFWRTAHELRLAVDDNGRGTGVKDGVSEGIGLTGMRERVSEFGGAVTAAAKDHGFSLQVSIPYTRGTD